MLESIVELVESAFKKGYDLDTLQVLAPMYRGLAGIDAINRTLQKNLIKGDDICLEVSGKIYFNGDKVLQLKNDYEQNIVNGDIGYVHSILTKRDGEPEGLKVDFGGNFVDMSKADVNYPVVDLGYCISIHKSQGSEYDVVIIPILNTNRVMLNRKLLYTAVTRAKKYLILLGEKSALNYAIESANFKKRNTSLCDAIVKIS